MSISSFEKPLPAKAAFVPALDVRGRKGEIAPE
jgi:hypothetical protein